MRERGQVPRKIVLSTESRARLYSATDWIFVGVESPPAK